MSRSYRKNARLPGCCVGLNGMRKWKHNTKQQRRAREKAQMNGIDEEDYDEETCTPIKYQKDKDMNDWAGPRDGWVVRGNAKRMAEELPFFEDKPWKLLSK